jgi:hypothetical protein
MEFQDNLVWIPCHINTGGIEAANAVARDATIQDTLELSIPSLDFQTALC